MKNLLFIFFIQFIIGTDCMALSSEPTQKKLENDLPLIIEFSNLNKRIWILNASEKDVHLLQGVEKK